MPVTGAGYKYEWVDSPSGLIQLFEGEDMIDPREQWLHDTCRELGIPGPSTKGYPIMDAISGEPEKTKASDIRPMFFDDFCKKAVMRYLGITHPHRGKMFYSHILDALGDVIEITTNFDERRFVITRDIYADEVRMVVGTKTILL